MKLAQTLLILLFLLPLSLKADVFDQIKSHRVGIVLSNSTLFTDSTYTAPSKQYCKQGALVTITQESYLEHEDDAQKQLYKWYQVKTGDNRIGWIFGDALLIKEKENLVPKSLKPYLYNKYRFNSGFENAMVWFGSVIGRDNFGAQLLSKTYEESYLIITNELARSVFIPISSASQFGESNIESFGIQELTGDQVPDFVLQSSIKDVENDQAQKLVQLYTFQAGTLRKVFEERLNIGNNGQRYKHLIFEKELIRGYYFENKNSKPQLYSFTYFWNKRSRRYEMLYPASPSTLRAKPNAYGVNLMSSPDVYAKTIRRLNTANEVRISRLVQQRWTERGKTYTKLCAAVTTNHGEKGYIPFQYLQLLDFKNTAWIQSNLLAQPIVENALSCIELPQVALDTTSIR